MPIKDIARYCREEDQRIALIECRKFAELQPHVPDWVVCLRCGRDFYSRDKKTIRICFNCKKASPDSLDRI